jgi:alcohol dehydrogenase
MQPSGTQLRQISALVEAGKIVPIIDRTFALADAQQALDYMESGRAKGKVVIKVR